MTGRRIITSFLIIALIAIELTRIATFYSLPFLGEYDLPFLLLFLIVALVVVCRNSLLMFFLFHRKLKISSILLGVMTLSYFCYYMAIYFNYDKGGGYGNEIFVMYRINQITSALFFISLLVKSRKNIVLITYGTLSLVAIALSESFYIAENYFISLVFEMGIHLSNIVLIIWLFTETVTSEETDNLVDTI